MFSRCSVGVVLGLRASSTCCIGGACAFGSNTLPRRFQISPRCFRKASNRVPLGCFEGTPGHGLAVVIVGMLYFSFVGSVRLFCLTNLALVNDRHWLGVGFKCHGWYGGFLLSVGLVHLFGLVNLARQVVLVWKLRSWIEMILCVML